MEQSKKRDFLIRNIPIEVYELLSKAANEHHRSKNQEAIVALTYGLTKKKHELQQPKPLKWKKKISSKFIEEALDEGRE